MTGLSQLRTRIARLRRRRRLARVAAGMSGLAVALCGTMAVLFLVDWQLDMGRAERLVAMAISAGLVSWFFCRSTWPKISHRETVVEVVLLVQREHHIDSDLVAALQFDAPAASREGSVRLREKVIAEAIELARRLDVTKGLRPAVPLRRLLAFVLAVSLVGLGLWRFPDHRSAFLDRLLLGGRRYPTRTLIVSVQVNGLAVDSVGGKPLAVSLPRGGSAQFDVTCSGRLPPTGRVELTAIEDGRQVHVALKPSRRPGVYSGTISPLDESIGYRIHLGDAWTEPAELLILPPPLVSLEFNVTEPEYVGGTGPPGRTFSAVQQFSVAEGSRVVLRLSSNKPLREAVFSTGSDRFPMVRDGQSGIEGDNNSTLAEGMDDWMLTPAGRFSGEVGPLDSVRVPIAYRIEVTDTDGMHPEHAVGGLIRIRPDHPPRVVASTITRYVLPAAHPEITYTATDDYGLAELTVLAVVTRGDGSVESRDEIPIFQLAQGQPAGGRSSGRYRIDLGPLDLSKGDQVAVTIRAVDYRGWSAGRREAVPGDEAAQGDEAAEHRPAAEGKSSQSAPLLFQVTDVEGILAAISRSDRESARRLEAMILDQIEVGGSP